MSTASTPDRRRTNHLILLSSLAIQLALLAYAAHVDANPVGGLKYTDVDWRVVYDGIMHTAHPRAGEVAEGPLALWLAERGVRIGSPYHRGTFRYTPLLVLVLSPALVAPVLGRLVLVALTLALPSLLLADPAVPFWTTHLLWTLNPIVLNITTRGSPEALACLLTAALVVFLRRAGLGSLSSKALRNPKSTNANTNAKPAMPAESRESAKWEAAAAVVLALAASYKIYPVIYVPAIWTALARRHGWFGARVWRFGLIAGGTAVGVNAALWLV
jgi:phosphatidylinositol glycan class M